ncbi:MAG: hypothetical protein E4H09_04595 [Spirochaetales bacterium]|nr:MAG: hypothetical protein E4H09_04595 [Spirochaetales bacterium]
MVSTSGCLRNKRPFLVRWSLPCCFLRYPANSLMILVRWTVSHFPSLTIVHGKGGKTRLVPMGQYAAYYIGLYLEKARKRLLGGKKADPGHLFLTSAGTPFQRQTINRSVMGRVNRFVDGDKRITCYSLRHAVATGLIAHGVDIAYMAQLLGHESLETTKRYLKIEIGDLKEMHARFHPRERVAPKI